MMNDERSFLDDLQGDVQKEPVSEAQSMDKFSAGVNPLTYCCYKLY